MKENTLSNCEKNFILKAASEQKRLDGRQLKEFRQLKVYFGIDWGACYATLGETRVLAQVTCDIQQPKTTRPSEGLLFVNVELSSMAAPHFEAGRSSDLSIHLNRLLEKCLKDSKAVDLESLCIVAEEKVWTLRVDVNILNHEGSLVDCASAAALAALAHFKRPDVTTDGVDITVHDISERDPIPITLHHYPVCVSFALLNNGENILADPTTIEERVSEANLVFGVNAYRELCGLHLGGSALAKPQLILKCSAHAAARAKEIVQIIKDALIKDTEARQSEKSVGLVEYFDFNKATTMTEDRLKIQLNKFTIHKDERTREENPIMEVEENEATVRNIVDLGDNSAELVPPYRLSSQTSIELQAPPMKIFKKAHNGIQDDIAAVSLGEGGPSKWEMELEVKPLVKPSGSSSEPEDDEVVVVPVIPKPIENVELSGDSEEEQLHILQSEDINNPKEQNAWKKPIAKTSNTSFNAPVNRQDPPGSYKPKRNRKKRKK